jgi:hypothetical protein
MELFLILGFFFISVLCIYKYKENYSYYIDAKTARKRYNKNINKELERKDKEYIEGLKAYKFSIYCDIRYACTKCKNEITFIWPQNRFAGCDESMFERELRAKGYKVNVNFGEFKVSW